MQVAPAQLAAQLKRGLRSLYTVHGDEALLVQEAADAIRAEARAQGCTERVVHTAAGAHFDWSAVLASGGSLSLFADRQLIEVRIPSGKPGKDGSEALQQMAEAAAGDEHTVTLVLLPRLDAATLKSAWFAALDSQGVTVKVETVERQALPGWIAQRLQLQGQRVEPGEAGQRTLQFFADRVEGNLLAAHQEIQKLGLLYPAGELNFDQVEELCSTWPATRRSSWPKRCWAVRCSACSACWTDCRPKGRRRCWCTGHWPRTSAPCTGCAAPSMPVAPCPWPCARAGSGG
jgi:DNA polymerase III subunit delta